jgi:hypothetical protein
MRESLHEEHAAPEKHSRKDKGEVVISVKNLSHEL